MTRIRLPLEHFTHLKEMPKPLKNELWALCLLHSEPHSPRAVVWAKKSDPFIFIERVFPPGRTSESYVVLDGELADTLRLLTTREDSDQMIYTLNRIGMERYQELLRDVEQEVAQPALRDVGIRGPFTKHEPVLEATVPALSMPHQQIIYLQAPTKLRLTTDAGEAWFVTLDGTVLNPPTPVP